MHLGKPRIRFGQLAIGNINIMYDNGRKTVSIIAQNLNQKIDNVQVSNFLIYIENTYTTAYNASYGLPSYSYLGKANTFFVNLGTNINHCDCVFFGRNDGSLEFGLINALDTSFELTASANVGYSETRGWIGNGIDAYITGLDLNTLTHYDINQGVIAVYKGDEGNAGEYLLGTTDGTNISAIQNNNYLTINRLVETDFSKNVNNDVILAFSDNATQISGSYGFSSSTANVIVTGIPSTVLNILARNNNGTPDHFFSENIEMVVVGGKGTLSGFGVQLIIQMRAFIASL